MSREVYISVDVETNGPIPGPYSMCSLGTVVVGRTDHGFYAIFQPISENVDPGTAGKDALSLEVMREQGVPPAGGMEAFAAWVQSILADGERPVFSAVNSPFDWMFSHWYFINFLGLHSDPFGHSGLDIKSYSMGMMNTTWEGASMRHMNPRFRSATQVHTHHALEDAKEQAAIFQRMLNFQRERHRRDAR